MSGILSRALSLIPGFSVDENAVVEAEYAAKTSEKLALEAEKLYIDEEAKLLNLQAQILVTKKAAELAVEKADKEEHELAQIEANIAQQVVKAAKERAEANEAEAVYRARESDAKLAEEVFLAAEQEVKDSLADLSAKEVEVETEILKLSDIVKDESIKGSFRWGLSSHNLNTLKLKGSEDVKEEKISHEAKLRKLEKQTRIAKEKTALAERARKPFLKELQEAEEAEQKLLELRDEAAAKRTEYQASRGVSDETKAKVVSEYKKAEEDRVKVGELRKEKVRKREAATKDRENAQRARKQLEKQLEQTKV